MAASAPRLKSSYRMVGEAVVLSLAGEMDLESAIDVRRALLDGLHQGRRLVIDLSAMTLIDSSGVACLLEALQAARKRGKDMRLAAVGPSVMRVFQLAHLQSVFTFAPSVEAALGGGT